MLKKLLMQHLFHYIRFCFILIHWYMTMLEYCKMILQKVSFDPDLFRTELLKAFRELIVDEITVLKKWCVETFGLNYCRLAVPEYIFDTN